MSNSKNNKKIECKSGYNSKINIFVNKHTRIDNSKMLETNNAPSDDFVNFLRKVRIKNGNKEVITHTNMCYPKGSFHIPENDMNQFISLYEREVKKGNKLGITEMPISHKETPLVIDIDFKYNNESEESIKRKHDIDTIKMIISGYQKVYGKYFSEQTSDDENTDEKSINLDKCYFFVTQRENPYISKNGCIKDGIHIVCPYYRANPSIHLKMRSEVLKDEKLIDCFENLGVIEKIDNIIDEKVICKNGWLMYGSSKPGKKPYLLTNIFNDKIQEIDIKYFDGISMPGFLSFWRNQNVYSKPSKELFEEFSKEQLIHNFEKNEIEEKSGKSKKKGDEFDEKTKTKKRKSKKTKRKIKGIHILDPENPKNLDKNLVHKSKILVNLLSKKRAKDKVSFKEVGECLYAIAPDEELLESWIDYGNKYKANTSKCQGYWESFEKKSKLSEMFTIKTLKFWASKDKPSAFIKFKRNELRKYFCNGGFTDTHNDIAQALKLIYELNYVCCLSDRSSKWYQFTKHRWSKMEQAVNLKRKLSREFAMEYKIFKDFCEIMSNYMIEKDNNDDNNIHPDFSELKQYSFSEEDLEEITSYEVEQEEWESRMLKCDQIIIKLKNNAFKSSLINEAKDEFFIKDFEEKLDSKKNLIAFENGVIDLDRRTFRYGRPDDFITLSTKTRYDPNFKKSIFYKDVLLFFSQIYPTEERFYDELKSMSKEEIEKLPENKLPQMMQYGLREKAQTLHGHNFEERFFVHIGTGGNGKSKLKELTENALGNYCINFPITLITGKRAMSNACTPEITRSKGRRNGHFDEPEDKARINTGLVKKFTGGDKIEGRDLHSPMIEFYFQSSIFLLCNNVPKIPPHDEGMIRRLTISNFKAKFVKNPDEKEPFEFRRDNNLSEKLKKIAPTFASMLVHWFYIYKDQGLNPPKEVRDYTSDFINQSDNYREFISDYIKISNNTNDFIIIKNLYNYFRNWNEENNSSRRLMSYKDFKDYLKNVFKSKIVNNETEGSIIKGHIINEELVGNRNNDNNRF